MGSSGSRADGDQVAAGVLHGGSSSSSTQVAKLLMTGPGWGRRWQRRISEGLCDEAAASGGKDRVQKDEFGRKNGDNARIKTLLPKREC